MFEKDVDGLVVLIRPRGSVEASTQRDTTNRSHAYLPEESVVNLQ